MSTTSFIDFAANVRPFVHGVPDVALIAAVKNAAIEFCDESMYWIYEHDPITTLEDIATYDLDAPCNGIPCRVLSAFFEECPMSGKSEDQLVKLFGSNWRNEEGDPRYYMQDRYEDLVVVPRPDARTANAITLRIAVKPTQASTEIDSDVFEQWAECIGYGARARLHEVPNQMYSDPAMSARCWAMFKHGIGKAKIERNRSLTRARQFLQPLRGTL